MIFKALSSETRVNIIKLLLEQDRHISGVAKSLGISVPVTARHVNILEQAGLIKKRVIGNAHLLSANFDGFNKIFEPFIEENTIHINKEESLYDALKQIPSIKINTIDSQHFISEVDGEQGYYLYGINGKKPDVSIDEYKPDSDVIIELDRIIPVHKRRIRVKINKKSKELQE